MIIVPEISFREQQIVSQRDRDEKWYLPKLIYPFLGDDRAVDLDFRLVIYIVVCTKKSSKAFHKQFDNCLKIF